LLLLALGAMALALALCVQRFRPAALVALLMLPFLHNTPAVDSLTLPGAEPYSAARLAGLRAAKSPAFIDITAAWCVTCLVNERTTLTSTAVQKRFARAGVHLLVGDWTHRDPAISRLLRANNRDGVPLYLYYPANAAPVMLPQLLTPAIVLKTVDGGPRR
jgi:thiol:disulfide interchange protein DsbD